MGMRVVVITTINASMHGLESPDSQRGVLCAAVDFFFLTIPDWLQVLRYGREC
jgi:hypothetical protein